MLPFLPERFESIFKQTYTNWEIFVFDSFSDDGAWEYLQDLAAREPRMRLMQGPRQGPYPAWNECLRQTTGEFVYIATSDDSMAPDCLEKFVAALDRHPSCDLAHCPLRVIDAAGVIENPSRWPGATSFALGLEDVVVRPHVRHAPYDGLVHLAGSHVYLSISQLLIRRSLFSTVGVFSNQWGNISDFNWEMKAALVADTVHVPDTWASWRIHPKQATVTTNYGSRERDRLIDEMVADALAHCAGKLSPKVVNSHWVGMTKELRGYDGYLGHGRGFVHRKIYQLRQLVGGSKAVRAEVLRPLTGKAKWYALAPQQIKTWLEHEGLGPVITKE